MVFAAVLSPTGGSRQLFLLGEVGSLALIVGPAVLQECEEVVRRKAPTSLPLLAQLLEAASTETAKAPSRRQIAIAKSYVRYGPDARVLAEAIHAKPDWFLTYDKEHFLRSRGKIRLPFEIGTPGDLLQRIKDNFTSP